MFTGLVEAVGKIAAASGNAPRRLTIASSIPSDEVAIGESVAIDGCCLTVVEKGAWGLRFEAATETLQRTTLGRLAVGSAVNLERALPIGGRLGGHLVSGHVDCVGTVRVREQRGSALYLGVEVDGEVARLTAARGSIALCGVSLTVTDVRERVFYVALIPHTLAVTTLDGLRPGTPVNVEADLVARYVERLLAGPRREGSLTAEFLKDKGFL